jgi:hypothetical protein
MNPTTIKDLEPIPKIDRIIAPCFNILSVNIWLKVKESMLEQLYTFQMTYGIKLEKFCQMKSQRIQ